MKLKHLIFLLTLSIGLISVYLIWMFYSNSTELKLSHKPNLITKVKNSEQNKLKKSGESKVKKPRFLVAGVEDDNEVKDFFLKFQKAVAEDDKQTVTSMVNYPFKVNFPKDQDNKRYTFIKNEKSFVKLYDRIFDKRLKSFITNVDVNYNEDQKEHVWAKYDGIAIGRGVIWIGVYCENDNCEEGKNYLKIRTIHGNSSLHLD